MNILLTGLALIQILLMVVVAKQWKILDRAARAVLAIVVLFFLPVGWGTAVVMKDMDHMKSTEFCLSCHVMGPYGDSLKIHDESSLPAFHYQNNYVPQKTACYDCHTNYSMFGPLEAKLGGMKHVYVNYIKGPPEKLKVYKPYENRNCLRCHGPAKKFLESEDHVDDLPAIQKGETSCLEAGCHDIVHKFKDEEL